MRGAASASASACSTSAGSCLRLCVPMMTSIRFERLSSAPASCCATQPATATTGVRPVSSTRLTHLPESRVELVFGALAHAARVDDDHIGVARLRRRLVAGLLQQPRHPFGVVDVHLAAVRLDEIFQGFAFALERPFAFASSGFALVYSLSPSNSRAAARAASVGAAPPIIRASSSTRSDSFSRTTCVCVRPFATLLEIWKCT